MCVRHAEKVEEEEAGKKVQPVPLWNEGNGWVKGVVVVVDVLCTNPYCLYRQEDAWYKQALSRGPRRTCGWSGCLTPNRCSLVVLPPGIPSAIRRRYVLKDPSVD